MYRIVCTAGKSIEVNVGSCRKPIFVVDHWNILLVSAREVIIPLLFLPRGSHLQLRVEGLTVVVLYQEVVPERGEKLLFIS